jgi:hypothetical protein
MPDDVSAILYNINEPAVDDWLQDLLRLKEKLEN